MTANDSKKISPDGAGRQRAGNECGRSTGRARGTQVRKRCNPNAGKESDTEKGMRADVRAAMPQIMRATLKKAKQGSLGHTKWVWGVLEKWP
jgi:hypothetical protein